jgi:hypothetical protein
VGCIGPVLVERGVAVGVAAPAGCTIPGVATASTAAADGVPPPVAGASLELGVDVGVSVGVGVADCDGDGDELGVGVADGDELGVDVGVGVEWGLRRRVEADGQLADGDGDGLAGVSPALGVPL